MRYLVLGAGALGGFFGARLLKGGADVTFLVRPKRAAQLRRDGLIVKCQDGEIRAPVKSIEQQDVKDDFDLILLCCKAYDLESAITSIAPAVGAQTAVLPLLNGVRHIDRLKERFGPEKVLGGITAINAALMPDGSIQQSELRVQLNALGELDGSQSSRCQAVKAALAAGGIIADLSGNIMQSMWTKFFAFAAIATIATLTRSRAGAIAQSEAGPKFVSAVLDECARIVSAEGYPPLAEGPEIVRGIFSQPNSTYGPSMLVDMEERRQTEAEHVIGDLVSRAMQKGVSAPILTAALCNLQAYQINGLAQ